jgi:hypothetical protein
VIVAAMIGYYLLAGAVLALTAFAAARRNLREYRAVADGIVARAEAELATERALFEIERAEARAEREAGAPAELRFEVRATSGPVTGLATAIAQQVARELSAATGTAAPERADTDDTAYLLAVPEDAFAELRALLRKAAQLGLLAAREREPAGLE